MSQYIRILDNERAVAIFAGAPNSDAAFIKRIIKQEKGIKINEYIQKNKTE
jgi:hypothetical protein